MIKTLDPFSVIIQQAVSTEYRSGSYFIYSFLLRYVPRNRVQSRREGALRDVSFHVPAGSSLAIVGPSGIYAIPCPPAAEVRSAQKQSSLP